VADILDQLLAAFDVEHREHIDAIRTELGAVRSGGMADIRQVFRRIHSLKGAARAVGLSGVEDTAHALESFVERFVEGGEALSPDDMGRIERELDAIERLATEERSGPEHRAERSEPAEYLRVEAAQMARLAASMHALSGDLLAVDEFAGALRDIHRQARGLARRIETVRRSATKGDTGLIDRLDALESESRALVHTLGKVSRRQAAAAWSLDQAVGRVREQIEGIAMVPASEVFSSLAPMVRELAREMGRNVEVDIQGMSVEADRLLLQGLRDPVLHLFRNALAHGIEPAAVRERHGKPPQGLTGLRIGIQGGTLRLAVFDDGAGPDMDRIAETARRKGLISPELRQGLTSDQLLALVFEPGFSTAADVDEIAGRGVGLSVVAEAAKAAGGSARMRRRMPLGTVVEIEVPVNLARQSILLALAGNSLYGIPTRAIERVLRIPADSLEAVEGRNVCRVDVAGNSVAVPVVPLSTVLGIPGSLPVEAGMVGLILMHERDRRVAIAVDRVEDVRTATLSEAGIGRDFVIGVVQIEGGEVAIVLSPEAVMARYEREYHAQAADLRPVGQSEDRGSRTILVVDDSITTRTLEKSILEAQGYRVLLSVDGLDALERLRSGGTPIDLIVADIEMPRMDGLQLLQALKGDVTLAGIPVILMTSRAEPDDVRRGLELGADAYLVKQRFDQRELVATIGQLL